MKTPKEQALDVLRTICAKHRIRIEHLLGHSLAAQYIPARREAIITLHDKFPKWTAQQIADVMNRDHTTISYHLGRKKSRTAHAHAGS